MAKENRPENVTEEYARAGCPGIDVGRAAIVDLKTVQSERLDAKAD